MLLFKLKVVNYEDYYYAFWMSKSTFLESVEEIAIFNSINASKEAELIIDSVSEVPFSKFTHYEVFTSSKTQVEQFEKMNIFTTLNKFVAEDS